MASGLSLQQRLIVAVSGRTYTSILQTRSHVSNQRGSVFSFVDFVSLVVEAFRSHTYSSFAVIVIFAFNTFDTGHPFSAASASF
jgi:hypothetical protein